MSTILESALTPAQHQQACAEDARQAEALRLHAAQFGHLGTDRTPALKADAISSAASESADRLTLTAARAYAHHTDGAELLLALERDAQRMAARCASARYAPMAEVVAGFMTALLRLMADLQPPRDSSLSYAEVFSAELGPVRVGFDASGVREVWTTRPTNVLSSMCNGDVDDLLAAARGLQ